MVHTSTGRAVRECTDKNWSISLFFKPPTHELTYLPCGGATKRPRRSGHCRACWSLASRTVLPLYQEMNTRQSNQKSNHSTKFSKAEIDELLDCK